MTMETDLGFTYKTKNGEVTIYHHGRKATTLRGMKAAEFIEDTELEDSDSMQQLMARLTGNYKHGNERTAKNHPRNRR